MSGAAWVALLLGCGVLLGAWRTRGHRAAARLALQVAAAGLLYLGLFPPVGHENFSAGQLAVLTPGATPAQRAALASASAVVALPGAEAPRDVERAPDLATALRRHPETVRLAIIGAGLAARDRDAARGRVATFEAAPLPRGVVELDAPAMALAGHRWWLAGRVEDAEGGAVELLDPAGNRVASAALDAAGRFRLAATAKGEGGTDFVLVARDRDDRPVDEVTVPLAVRRGVALKVLLLAGAPDPELKYFRRWAADAGLEVASRIGLSKDIVLREGAAALDAATLAASDLVIIDERAWGDLDGTARGALVGAVRGGLGLVLRPSGALPAAVAADWADLGYRIEPAEPSPPLHLDEALGLADLPALRAPPLAVEAPQAAPLLRADDGSALAWVRREGRGRVALWLLADAWRVELAGAGDAYGSLWSDVLAATAREGDEVVPVLPVPARVDERAILCGLASGAEMEDAAGRRTPLVVGADRCAGFWPEVAGWHALVEGAVRWPFHVRALDEAPALLAGETRRATQALPTSRSGPDQAGTRERPLPRWPFLLAFLVVAALLWWLERAPAARTGR